MTRRTTFVITLCCTLSSLFAQEALKPVIATTVSKGDYFVIPKGVLEKDSVDAILYQHIPKNRDSNKRPIQFYWASVCNDGYYNLTITPEQVFFHSSHDNPNPNFLFWVIDIDRSQYQQIRNGIDKKLPQGFENFHIEKDYPETVLYDKTFKNSFSIPEEWTEQNEKIFKMNCDAQVKEQLERYFSIINSYIIDQSQRISIPAFKPKRKAFSYSQNDIIDWLPKRFKSPKKNS